MTLRPRVVSVVGYRGSGKTSIVGRLLAELKRRGRRVGSIKSASARLEIDREGKDTWRHMEAGAETVVAIGHEKTFVMTSKSVSLDDALDFFEGFDYVLVEGFKGETVIPRILTVTKVDEIGRLRNGLELAISGTLAKSKERPRLDVPIIDGEAEVDKLADLVEKKSFPKLPELDCGDCGYRDCYGLAKELVAGNEIWEKCRTLERKVSLVVNEKEVGINPFVQEVIKNTILGMIAPLKGVMKPERVVLKISDGKGEGS